MFPINVPHRAPGTGEGAGTTRTTKRGEVVHPVHCGVGSGQ